MGRHPFAGQYLGQGDKDLSESIREYRFAYGAGSLARNVRQPPGSPSLEIVPRQIATLFEKAFTQSPNRPSPTEWRSALVELSHNLAKCNHGHHFLKSLAECPWCKLERESGLKFFLGIILQNLGWRDFNLAKVWRDIGEISLPPDAFPTAPGVLHRTLGLFKPGKSLGVGSETLSLRWMLLTANLVLVVWFIGSICGMFSPSEAGLFGCLIGILCLLLPYQRYTRQRKKLENEKSLVESRSNQGRLLAQLNDEKRAFQQKHAELEAIKKQYDNLGSELHLKLVDLESNARQRQLEKFLDSFDIYDARIPGIGEQRKATLISYGIETAADVHYSRIQGVVPGFGPANTSKLVAWRQGIEIRFHFDPNKGVDPRDKQAVEQEVALKRRNGESELSAGPVRLKQIIERVKQLQELVRKDIELNSKDIEEAGKKLAFLLHLKKLFVPLWGMTIVLAVWWLGASPLQVSQNRKSSSSNPSQSTGSSTSNDTDLAVSLYKQGVSYTKSRQFERAIDLYQQAITANPDYAEAYHELGYALFRLSRHDEAITACLRAISLRPNYADTRRNLAKCYSAKGDVDNQIHTLKVAITLTPNHLESVYQLAEALFKKESYEEATERYVTVLELNPEFDKAWYKLGLLYLKTGSIEKAHMAVDQLQNLNPDLANSLLAEIEKEIR